MKSAMFVLLLLVAGCQNHKWGNSLQGLTTNLKTTVTISDSIDEFGARYAEKYRVDIALVDRDAMGVVDGFFDGKSIDGGDNNTTFFCVIRVYMDVESSFPFTVHKAEISVDDQDLRRNGLRTISPKITDGKDVFYQVIKMDAYSEEREQLFKKTKVTVTIRELRFG